MSESTTDAVVRPAATSDRACWIEYANYLERRACKLEGELNHYLKLNEEGKLLLNRIDELRNQCAAELQEANEYIATMDSSNSNKAIVDELKNIGSALWALK